MPPRFKTFLATWFINTLGVLVAAHLVRGIHYESWGALLIASLMLGILNALLRPVLLVLSLPLVLLTLGFFLLIINALLLGFVGWLVEGFHVATFGSAFWGALIVSLVSLILNPLLGVKKIADASQRDSSTATRPRDSDGPVIDV
ncbi:MAG: phage holin family protein [Verrucomicrobia bacterium]|nr:phage holin family protein [Verrucomicrobiota bacterium]